VLSSYATLSTGWICFLVFLFNLWAMLLYTVEPLQRPPLEQKKVAIVERWKQELMYGLSARKHGRCREMAFVERWPLEEVRL